MNKKNLHFSILFLSFFLFLTACSKTLFEPVQDKSTLSIESAIVYKVGGVQPVARSRFFLLDKSAEDILKSANLKPQSDTMDRALAVARKQGMNPDIISYLNYLKFAFKSPEDYSEYFAKFYSEIEKHTIKSDLTDLQGKLQFEEIQPNNYFIFGIAETRSGFAIWDFPIKIEEKKQSIILDQNNATE